MSVELADVRGPRAPLATNLGYETLRAFMERAPHAPLCNEFALRGATTSPARMAWEIDRLLPDVRDEDLRATLTALRDALLQCREVAIALM